MATHSFCEFGFSLLAEFTCWSSEKSDEIKDGEKREWTRAKVRFFCRM
jgi:hypothetical protein